jgi:hypothetical protein
VSREHRGLDVVVEPGEREHVEAGVHDLAHDAVGALLVETGGGVEHAGIESRVPTGDAFVGRWIVEAMSGDAETADRDPHAAGQDDELSLAGDEVDAWCPRAELGFEAVEHRCRFHDVGIARVVAHEPSPGSVSERLVDDPDERLPGASEP